MNQKALYAKLSTISASYGKEGPYEKGKSNLKWLRSVITDNPKLVEIAINNSSLREKPSMPLFLTVHKLVSFLKSLEPR